MGLLAIMGGRPVRVEPWPAYPQHGPEVQEAILRVARSNCYHPQFGKETEVFERAFAAYHGVKHAVAVANGTLAIQAAMAAADIGCGDEVIVPAYAGLQPGLDAGGECHLRPGQPGDQGPADQRRRGDDTGRRGHSEDRSE